MGKIAELRVVRKKLSDVKPNPKNPRLHSPDQLRRLEKSLVDFGYSKGSMVVNSDGYLLAGHGMYEAMKSEGYESADFVEVDLPLGKAEAFLIADNRLGDLSTWDLPLLNAEIAELQDMDIEIESTGFELDELADFQSDNSVTEDDFDIEGALEEEPITKTGDLWLLGDHRLLCGDSTLKADVERLMDGERARYAMCDPPYGIGVIGGAKAFGSIGGANIVSSNIYPVIYGDDKPFDPEPILDICPDSILWGANYYAQCLPPRKGWLVWDKKGREWEDNFSDCELAWTPFDITTRIYRHVWMGMVQEGNREKRVHPTQKPVLLFYKIMCDLFMEVGTILDLFIGSGTTLIAADQLNRTCYGMEIEPKYCDVTVKRYINHVGTSEDVYVERDGKKLSWSEVSDEG